MNLRQNIFSNYLFRVILRSGDLITNYNNQEVGFIPFFQYSIGGYHDNFNLYFQKKPTIPAYYNEIFNKMDAYYANDAIEYIKFHFERYPNKHAFLDFLFYELRHRINRLENSYFFNRSNNLRRKSILQMALLWVVKQREDIQAQNKQTIYATFLRNDLKVIVNNYISENGTSNTQQNNLAGLRETLFDEVDKIVGRIEEKTSALLGEMRDSYLTGDIETSHPKSIDLFVIAMLVVKDYENNKSKLFNGFSDNDIAKILRLHFEYFKRKGIEIDTIRKKYMKPISERFYSSANDRIRKEIDFFLEKLLH